MWEYPVWRGWWWGLGGVPKSTKWENGFEKGTKWEALPGGPRRVTEAPNRLSFTSRYMKFVAITKLIRVPWVVANKAGVGPPSPRSDRVR